MAGRLSRHEFSEQTDGRKQLEKKNLGKVGGAPIPSIEEPPLPHCPPRVASASRVMQPNEGKVGSRRPGRLRGIVDAMASPESGDPSSSSGPAAVADAPTGRRTRFAPKVPSERRARAPRTAVEDTAEPKLSTHVQHLVKQAHLEGKTVRPREPVRGLEQRRPRRGEVDHSKPGSAGGDGNAQAVGSSGAAGTSTSAMDVSITGSADAPEQPTHTAATFSAGRADTKKESKRDKETKAALKKSKEEKHEPSLEATMPGASPMDLSDGDDDHDVNKDWTDKTQYYPTVLRPCPELGGSDANGMEIEKSETTETSVADRLLATETNDEYLVVQLPSLLSLAKTTNDDDVVIMDGDDISKQSEDHRKQSDGFGTAAASMSELDEGKLGELEVLKDGSVRLVIGDASYDMVSGTRFAHVEQLACVDTKMGSDAKCAFLGRIPSRLVVIPDVASLLKAPVGR